MQSISKNDKKPSNLGDETIRFIWKKYKGLYPDILIAWIIGFFFVVFVRDLGITETINLLFDGFWQMTLLHMTGIYPISINGSVWYISSMLLCMTIMYPLIRKNKDMAIKVVFPVITLIILGVMYKTDGHPRGPMNWIGLTYKGNLRAFAEIYIGILCFEIAKIIEKIKFKRYVSSMLILFKYLIYISVILYMNSETAKYDGKNQDINICYYQCFCCFNLYEIIRCYKKLFY